MATKKTETTGNGKRQRNAKSWKAEAKRLEVMLAAVCADVIEMAGNPGLNMNKISEGLGDWWNEWQERTAARQEAIKATALRKLSAEQRRALGLEDE